MHKVAALKQTLKKLNTLFNQHRLSSRISKVNQGRKVIKLMATVIIRKLNSYLVLIRA